MKKVIAIIFATVFLLVGCGEESVQVVGECEMYVTCESALTNDNISEEKREILPEDGVIFSSKTVEISDKDSVLDILERAMRENKIHIEFSTSSVYNSVYVEGIANLYQQDAGEMSGWLYKVNGESPDVSMSDYEVGDGDKIEIYYSCDFLEDM